MDLAPTFLGACKKYYGKGRNLINSENWKFKVLHA